MFENEREVKRNEIVNHDVRTDAEHLAAFRALFQVDRTREEKEAYIRDLPPYIGAVKWANDATDQACPYVWVQCGTPTNFLTQWLNNKDIIVHRSRIGKHGLIEGIESVCSAVRSDGIGR